MKDLLNLTLNKRLRLDLLQYHEHNSNIYNAFTHYVKLLLRALIVNWLSLE